MPHKTAEERAAYNKAYREKNREALAAKKQAYRATLDPEQQAAYMSAYYAANRDRMRAQAEAWRKANREAANAHRKAWRKANPEGHRVAQEARRAKVSAGSFTLVEWRELLDEFDNRCAYCQAQGVLLEIEHMTPLSRGGAHAKDNIVPSCAPCNRRKYNRTIFEFLAL